MASLRILCELAFPSKTWRLWEGAGPMLDGNGELWLGARLPEGAIDQIETALNGEAAELMLSLMATDPEVTKLAYEDLMAGDVIGSPVRILIQECDEWDQPAGEPEVRFTGKVANMPMGDSVDGDAISSRVTLRITNRFDLRNAVSGSVLSDPDQKARSARINLGAALDRFCERIAGLVDKAVWWPRFT